MRPQRAERIIQYLLGPSMPSFLNYMDRVQGNPNAQQSGIFSELNRRAEVALAIKRGRITIDDLRFVAGVVVAMGLVNEQGKGDILENLARIEGCSRRTAATRLKEMEKRLQNGGLDDKVQPFSEES